MTVEAKSLLQQVLALPEPERAALFDTLAESFQLDQVEVDEAWRAELLRRVEQVRNGEVTLESWDDVREAMKLRFHPDARVEYIAAILYIDDRRPGYGDRLNRRCSRRCHAPASSLERGTQVHGAPNSNMRSFSLRVFRYSVLIGFEGDEAVIHAVAHQHRRPDYWRDRLQ